MPHNSQRLISKSQLKAKMLEHFRDVERTGEELVVTSNGKPVLKIVPYSDHRSAESVFEDIRGNASWVGDLDEPTIDEWEIR